MVPPHPLHAVSAVITSAPETGSQILAYLTLHAVQISAAKWRIRLFVKIGHFTLWLDTCCANGGSFPSFDGIMGDQPPLNNDLIGAHVANDYNGR